LLRCGYEGGFEGTPALVQLAAEDFFGRGVDEAEFADGEVVVVVAHGRAEGAAGNGACGVEIAGAGGGVEDGTGFVVSEVVEGLFVVGLGEELAGGGISGKVWREARARGCGAGVNLLGDGGFGGCEGLAEGRRIELRDGKDADAALVAAGLAGQPVTGARSRRGEGGVEDGKEGRQGVESKE
jgi:hypothetical protein